MTMKFWTKIAIGDYNFTLNSKFHTYIILEAVQSLINDKTVLYDY